MHTAPSLSAGSPVSVSFSSVRSSGCRIRVQDKFVKSAQQVVSVGQIVKVRVMSVDATTGRIALSMKAAGRSPPQRGQQ